MIKVLDAVFVATATEVKQCPREPLPEVAFVGRSNVGKSSMINTLVNRKKLVRVSHTPGRTRTMNFFDVTLEHGSRKRRVRLCDLPGYGFAKVSKTERAQWQEMISAYLNNRRDLKVVVSIIDAEVGPTPDDVQMLDFLQAAPPRILIAATKLDRLSKSHRVPRIRELTKQLDVPEGTVVGFSALENIGHTEVWGRLLEGTS
ncbi:MAG: YihA family ribosome biogenesis GTP-binding protein [Archangium sp.]|nr:YihA family ribosome biogenesis GTP-binding protein [Archangium sp.]